MARNTNSTGFSLKDELFNQRKVTYLATLLADANTNFDQAGFEKTVMARLLELELKERIAHIADCLEQYLDQDYKKAVRQIVDSLPPPLDPLKTDDDFGDFIFAPFGEYVARHGATKARLTVSLKTLRELTMRFSMEDAIRTFINAFPDETYVTLERWSKDKNYHVRRLASEGPRPLLPWSTRLSTPIERALPLLDQLHADPTRYVVRSVANHLNDISKSEPKLVIATLTRWQTAGRQEPAELAWLTKHALRTLVKQGYPKALAMLGYRPNPRVTVKNGAVSKPTIRVGEAVEFCFEVTAAAKESLLIDYVVYFVKANGEQKPKVHKLTTLTMAKGETSHICKKHYFKAGASTLTYYPGVHTIELQINGRQFGSVDFELHT